MDRLVVISSASDYLGVMPQFFQYYHDIGVEAFYICLTDQVGDGMIIDQANRMSKLYNCHFPFVYEGKHRWTEQCRMIRQTMQDHIGPDDWVLLPDLDEFHEYPSDLISFFQECDKLKANVVVGQFLDRISSNGRLINLDCEKLLTEQFPLGCRISTRIVGAPRLRTVAVKGNVDVYKHWDHNNDPVLADYKKNNFVKVHPHEVEIHHFKWHNRVLGRLQKRKEFYEKLFKSGENSFALYEESERIIAYLRRNGRRIDVHDKILSVRTCEPIQTVPLSHQAVS